MPYVFQMRPVLESLERLFEGLGLSLAIGIGAGVVGIATGWLLALGSASPRKMVHWCSVVYIEFWRNTPLVIQLFFVYFGITSLTGFSFTAIQAGFITIVLNTTAYNAEILRGGLQAIPRVQLEAASSLGLSPFAIVRTILVPWTMKVVFPSLTNQFILVLLGTSVLSIVSVPELMNTAKHLQTITGRTIELYLATAAMYVVAIMSCSLGLAVLESRYFTLSPRRAGHHEDS